MQKLGDDCDAVLYALSSLLWSNDLRVADATWRSIPAMAASTLKKELNPGVELERVRLRAAAFSDEQNPARMIVLAAYAAEPDFYTEVIVEDGRLIAKYEN